VRILVCPPEFFAVDYVINPWMKGQLGRVDRVLAHTQWSELIEAFARIASVEEISPRDDSPDMCFTANAGLTAFGRVIPASFRMPERTREEEPFLDWFARQGFDVVSLSGEDSFEGEGDALFQPGEPLLWAGYGVRSALETHSVLGETFGAEVVSLRLVDPRFYHLDTCFAPLPDGRLIYYPAAFDARSRRRIERRIPAAKRIMVDEKDAIGFACNILRIEDQLFLNQASSRLRTSLAEWGFETRIQPVSEFLKAGGGVKCLSLILDQTPFLQITPPPSSPIRARQVELKGHLLDDGCLGQALDLVIESGCSFRITSLALAERKDQESRGVVRVVAPSQESLDRVLLELIGVGARPLEFELLAERDSESAAVESDPGP
jgi:N-dimethylarginine dimethylaminohydrolase